MKLEARQVEKPWGRDTLPSPFQALGGRKIGEIWFEGPDDLPLLAKYIFTSEKLSIQVHPGEEAASRRGLRRGKSECWYILDAAPGALLGLGLTEDVSPDRLREAALDGSIEGLIAWRPVTTGDFFFVPAGTVHAIGGGISLLEFQQNSDVTYRLYDYGRPRDLHLDDAIAVASPGRYVAGPAATPPALHEGPPFVLLRLTGPSDQLRERRRWVLPVAGVARSGADTAGPGECLLVEPGAPLNLSSDAVVFLGAEAA
jgi:mannose-6-phosphate isomerase